MKNILLTGGTGNIGEKIKNLFSKNNYYVDNIERNVLDLSTNNLKLNKKYINKWYDCFIHCAGVNFLSNLYDLSEENIEKTLNINLLSFINIIKQINIKKEGNIIAIGSIFSNSTRKKRISYTISKHGLIGAVRSLSVELASQKVKVNMVSPGYILNKLTYKNNNKNILKRIKNVIPLNRFVKEKEIANICLFLCEKNLNITGQNIFIDGGISTRYFDL